MFHKISGLTWLWKLNRQTEYKSYGIVKHGKWEVSAPFGSSKTWFTFRRQFISHVSWFMINVCKRVSHGINSRSDCHWCNAEKWLPSTSKRNSPVELERATLLEICYRYCLFKHTAYWILSEQRNRRPLKLSK